MAVFTHAYEGFDGELTSRLHRPFVILEATGAYDRALRQGLYEAGIACHTRWTPGKARR